MNPYGLAGAIQMITALIMIAIIIAIFVIAVNVVKLVKIQKENNQLLREIAEKIGRKNVL